MRLLTIVHLSRPIEWGVTDNQLMEFNVVEKLLGNRQQANVFSFVRVHVKASVGSGTWQTLLLLRKNNFVKSINLSLLHCYTFKYLLMEKYNLKLFNSLKVIIITKSIIFAIKIYFSK